jgi:hypothetical protein
MVIDHMNYAVTDVEGDHTLIAGDDLIHSDVILGSEKIEVSTDAKNLHNLFNLLHIFMFIGLNRIKVEYLCALLFRTYQYTILFCCGSII